MSQPKSKQPELSESSPVGDESSKLPNLNSDPERPYDLYNFYYPPGQTSLLYH
jgi:hypothetical protein